MHEALHLSMIACGWMCLPSSVDQSCLILRPRIGHEHFGHSAHPWYQLTGAPGLTPAAEGCPVALYSKSRIDFQSSLQPVQAGRCLRRSKGGPHGEGELLPELSWDPSSSPQPFNRSNPHSHTAHPTLHIPTCSCLRSSQMTQKFHD